MAKTKVALPIEGIPVEMSGQLDPADIRELRGWDMENKRYMVKVYREEKAKQDAEMKTKIKDNERKHRKYRNIVDNRGESKATRKAAERRMLSLESDMAELKREGRVRQKNLVKRAYKRAEVRAKKERKRQVRAIRSSRARRKEFDKREDSRWKRDFE